MNTGLVQHTAPQSQPHLSRAFSALLLATLAGCVSLPAQAPISSQDIAWVLAGADLVTATDVTVTEDLTSLMHVTEDMRRFALNATRNAYRTADKTEALTAALTGDQQVRYDSDATLTAEQAFTQRRANCLTYTLLFIALAREVGITARFNEVDIPPVWDLGGENTLLLYRHINVRVELNAPWFQIVDVSGDEYNPNFDQRIIADDAALGQFYNNRAVELRLQGQHTDALRYQLRALKYLPEAHYLWTNLSGLYLLNKQPRAARIAVTKALALDASSVLNYSAAANVYAQIGEHSLASYFRGRAEYFLDQNPYYHYQLALAALKEPDKRHAYEEVRRAILLNPKDPRFFFLAAVLLDHLGEAKLSQDLMQVALQLTPDPAQQERYRSKFGRLTVHG